MRGKTYQDYPFDDKSRKYNDKKRAREVINLLEIVRFTHLINDEETFEEKLLLLVMLYVEVLR